MRRGECAGFSPLEGGGRQCLGASVPTYTGAQGQVGRGKELVLGNEVVPASPLLASMCSPAGGDTPGLWFPPGIPVALSGLGNGSEHGREQPQPCTGTLAPEAC